MLGACPGLPGGAGFDGGTGGTGTLDPGFTPKNTVIGTLGTLKLPAESRWITSRECFPGVIPRTAQLQEPPVMDAWQAGTLSR
jgi:hypothetical protein